MRRVRYIGAMASPSDRKIFDKAIAIAKERGALVTTHDLPDADGLGSAYCIKKHLSSVGGSAEIVAGGRRSSTDRLIGNLGMEVKSWQEIPEHDRRPLIVVDTNSPALLSCTGRRSNPLLLVVDHHRRTPPLLNARFSINNETAISACEIVASLLQKRHIDSASALALAIGIAGDSERLNYAERETLLIFEELLGISGATKKTIDELAYPPMKPEILAAILQEMRQLHIETYEGRVIAVGPSRQDNPAILATALRDLNVAIIAILNEIGSAWYKISFRVDLKEAHLNRIHASDIAINISRRFRMPKHLQGGGHIDKAGALVRGSYQEIAKAIIETAKEAIDRAKR